MIYSDAQALPAMADYLDSNAVWLLSAQPLGFTTQNTFSKHWIYNCWAFHSQHLVQLQRNNSLSHTRNTAVNAVSTISEIRNDS